MRLHADFEWDLNKAKANARKHRVTFDDAAGVLGDDQGDTCHVDEHDDANSRGEDRMITTGSHPDDRRIILRICWTDRSTEDEQITRIISARLATTQERNRYAKALGDQ